MVRAPGTAPTPAVPARGGVAARLAARLAADGAQPFVTYYDDAAGERTELSVATLNNWVAKTANLLVDGLALQPGDTARIAVPPHWQEVAIRFACLCAGAEIVSHGPSAVLFWAEAGGEPPRDAEDVVGVSLRPLRAGLRGTYPGVLDYDEDLPTFADSFHAPPPEPEQLQLVDAALRRWPLAPGDRVLLAEPDPDGLVELAAVATERASLVLWRDLDDGRLAQRCASERVTAVARGGALTRA